MTMAQKLMAKLNNEEIADENRELNKTVATVDKGMGFLLDENETEKEKKLKKFADKDLEYPNLQLIFCRKGVVGDPKAPNPGAMKDEQIAFIDGGECNEAYITLRLDNLKAGEYYVLYRVDFKPYHKIRKLNVVFYSEFMQKKSQMELDAEIAALRVSDGSSSIMGAARTNKYRPKTATSKGRPQSAIS